MNIEKLDFLRYEAVMDRLYDVTDKLDPFEILELISQGLLPALMVSAINPNKADLLPTLCDKFGGEYSRILLRTWNTLNLNFDSVGDRLRCCEVWHLSLIEGFIGAVCEDD